MRKFLTFTISILSLSLMFTPKANAEARFDIRCWGPATDGTQLEVLACIEFEDLKNYEGKPCQKDAGLKIKIGGVEDGSSYIPQTIGINEEIVVLETLNDGLMVHAAVDFNVDPVNGAWNTLKVTQTSNGKKYLSVNFACKATVRK